MLGNVSNVSGSLNNDEAVSEQEVLDDIELKVMEVINPHQRVGRRALANVKFI